jgi:predicted transcriptional regulator
MPDDALFLSIKPRFATEIIAGRKTVELRRTRPRGARDGSMVVIYASSPVRAVIGTFEVDRVVSGCPDSLWDEVAERAGLSREEYDAYFDGASEAVAIFVRSTDKAGTPYSLDAIRRECPSFHPPQAFRYIGNMGAWAVEMLSTLMGEKSAPAPEAA